MRIQVPRKKNRKSRPFRETAPTARHANGRFKKGEPGPRLTHGRFSQIVRQLQHPEQAAFLAARAERIEAIKNDLGGADTLSTITLDTVDTYNEQVGLLRYLGGRLAAEGPLSPKGRQRALLTAYLGVADRVLKLATTLGLSKKAKRVPSIEDFIRERQQEKGEPA